MRRDLLLAGTALLALTGVSPASAQLPVASGNLSVTHTGPSACPSEGFFFSSETVQISGGTFNGNVAVEVYFSIEGDDPALIATRSADGQGRLDAMITLPAELSTPVTALLEARGEVQGGDLSLTSLFTLLTSAGGDSDSDLVPDVCDNCSAVSNSGQEDDDLDGVGNVCDTCPQDPDNDRDGDGVCADADACPADPDNDFDGDQVCGNADNCPTTANANQVDLDGNGIGDACQTNPTCSDGIDNDGDGLIDHPADPGCTDAADIRETDPALPCDDGLDNDADALVDFVSGGGLGDPGCASGSSPAEDPECDNGIDDDGDGKVDWDGKYGEFPVDDGCAGDGSGATEMPEPGMLWGLGSGGLLLIAIGRLRRRRVTPAGVDRTAT